MNQVDLLGRRIDPADGESTVRTYLCTHYKSKLLGIEAQGFLSVTNKRVIFHAMSGTSVIQSEVPVQDVSGLSSYKGTFFSFGHIVAALIVSSVLAPIAPMITGVIGVAIQAAAIESGNWENLGRMTGALIVGWVIAIGAFIASLSVDKKSIWKSILAAVAGAALAGVGGAGLIETLSSSLLSQAQGAGQAFALLLAFGVGIYGLVCVVWYARRPTFTLSIHSKGGSSTPISITGGSGIGILTVRAERALRAEPAHEAGLMLEEIGALILDIQMLGTYAVEKWTGKSSGQSAGHGGAE